MAVARHLQQIRARPVLQGSLAIVPASPQRATDDPAQVIVGRQLRSWFYSENTMPGAMADIEGKRIKPGARRQRHPGALIVAVQRPDQFGGFVTCGQAGATRNAVAHRDLQVMDLFTL